jgi:hypothetical protein
MIRYALSCEAGHGFESWFRESTAFDDQVRSGLLACPQCGSRAIEKQIMAPAVAVKDEAPAQPRPVAMIGEKDARMRAMVRALHRHLQKNADDVGANFAEEARKIHYGETDERAIYGVASEGEARELHEEGIDVLPVPVLPDDRN